MIKKIIIVVIAIILSISGLLFDLQSTFINFILKTII